MESEQVHPHVAELAEEVTAGRLSKRNFLKYASFLGTSFHVAGSLIGLHTPEEIRAEAGYDWHELDEESPFEIKNLLKDKAEKACAQAKARGESARVLDAGREIRIS